MDRTKIKIEPVFKTIHYEQADGSTILKSYIAIDEKKKWYLHNGMFKGTYGIHNYETDEFICGISENGNLYSMNKVNINDFPIIKKLYSKIIHENK